MKKHKGYKGRGLSSSHSRQSKSIDDFGFNPHNEDNMTSSQHPPPSHEATPIARAVLAYVPMPMSPTNGSIEVVRRHIALLDNLGPEPAMSHN